MEAKLAKVYYSPQGYWKGIAATKKLANAAKVSEDIAKTCSGWSSKPFGRFIFLHQSTCLNSKRGASSRFPFFAS